MLPHQEFAQAMTRRHFFRQGALGLGGAALASLLADGKEGHAAAPLRQPTRYGGLPSLPHFAPKAKRAIYLFMNGGPAQMDLWDYKPKMREMFDKDLPKSIINNQRLTTMTSGQSRFPVAPSRFEFVKTRCGTPITELLPWTAKVVDKMCVINSVHTEAINHDPAVTYICTGNQIPGRPSMGAWLSYGLGSETKDLPSFVVMTPSWSAKNDPQALYNRLWGSGFLPSQYQGVALRSQGDPVLFLSNPKGVSPTVRRVELDALAKLNKKQADEVADPETLARIAQYEMAFRMQSSVPELMDLSKEPRKVRDTYGPDAYKPGTFASSCLLGRRLLERGVRFVQIFLRGWDAHGDLVPNMRLQCQDIDQATYGLLTDLEQRGMLEDTLVVWGGEFGRTSYCQGKLTRENYGRDHHPRCFSTWMAGGGIKPGIVYGKTDDFSYNVVENPVHIHDMNATILHCLGIDHKKLTFKFQGLDVRLTGVEDNGPVRAILA